MMTRTPPAPLCFAFRGGELLVREAGAALEIPDAATLELGRPPARTEEPFLAADGSACLAIELPDDATAPPGLTFRSLRRTHGGLPDDLFALAGRAFQLLEWSRGHRFCGRCGTRTVASEREQAKLCPACGASHFPRLSPAVIVAVRRGDTLLLARSPRFAPGMYSVLAGFVEPGESLEEAVAREVREEVGVEVADIRYFGSQPWPFPHSLMIGFTAEHAAGELRPDGTEVEDAGWFSVDALPVVPPRLSIARWLIEHFVRERGGDPNRLRSP